jgi:hypothetical protein
MPSKITKKPRRKSIRKEPIKMIVEGDKNRMTFTLRPDLTPRVEIESKEVNPNKISFGNISDGKNRLEFASYDKTYAQNAFIFLNGERIMIDKYTGRKLYALVVKMGWFLGVNKRKKAKN